MSGEWYSQLFVKASYSLRLIRYYRKETCHPGRNSRAHAHNGHARILSVLHSCPPRSSSRWNDIWKCSCHLYGGLRYYGRDESSIRLPFHWYLVACWSDSWVSLHLVLVRASTDWISRSPDPSLEAYSLKRPSCRCSRPNRSGKPFRSLCPVLSLHYSILSVSYSPTSV